MATPSAAESAANATVKTVQFIDPRIEPQPDPVYDYIIGPTQNQYYKIPASGLSNSNITFNNLTTLGVDRAYLDTFELEITATFSFNIAKWNGSAYAADITDKDIIPAPDEWTFQSFPFNTCCSEAHININGGAFMSQPMCYLRAKERYMNQYELSKCYENVCPVHRPICQTESGRVYNPDPNATGGVYNRMTPKEARELNLPVGIDLSTTVADGTTYLNSASAKLIPTPAVPTRYGCGMFNYMQSSEGMVGGFNNSIVDLGEYDTSTHQYKNMKREGSVVKITVTWREPVMCSPFSSRYDATYGRPLYNITSMDFSFTMMDLGNMIRLCNLHAPNGQIVESYSVNIDKCQICYQVMTIPAVLKKPTTTLVPYRRFTPYITEFNSGNKNAQSGTSVDLSQGSDSVSVTSGVYTFNQVPTAIWVFFAPTKSIYQTNPRDTTLTTTAASQFNPESPDADKNDMLRYGNWESNNLFGYLKSINITLANTTQILSTATALDLYRIAKMNGCEDSYQSWARMTTLLPKDLKEIISEMPKHRPMYYGAGSVLRLVPGTDIIVPDTPLIPGANANNMVLQVTAEFSVPPHSKSRDQYALWLLFEEVGVAAISPGQCEISMNPVGSGEIMGVSPVMSSTTNYTEGALAGFGWRDNLKKAAQIASHVADSGIISRILKTLGHKRAGEWAGKIEDMAKEPVRKMARGGAVIGHGMNDWI